MSVAGILAGALFSGAGTQYAQESPLSSINTSSAPSAFAAVQQQLLQSGSVAPASSRSVHSELTQLSQDLKSGNLSAAQADYSALKITLAQLHMKLTGQSQSASAAGGDSDSQAGTSGTASQSSNITNPLAAAMLAYSSLQQNPNNVALSSSLITPASTFSINA